MKRKMMLGVIAAMVVSMAVPAYALPSISTIAPQNPTVVSGENYSSDEQLTIVKADTTKYADTKVQDVVKKTEDKSQTVTVTEITKELVGEEESKNVTTTKGKKINTDAYERATDFVDLVIKKEDQISYESKGEVTATVNIEVAKGMKKEDVLLMQIDPQTGKPYFIEVDKLDPETGDVTATFPTLGPVMLIEKSILRTDDLKTEEYENTAVKETMETYKDQKDGIVLADLTKGITGEEATEIEVGGEKLDPKNMKSAMPLTDLFVQVGKDDASYDLEGDLDIHFVTSLDKVDYEEIIKKYDPDFDFEAVKNGDYSGLIALGKIKIPGSCVAQTNTKTGEVSYIEATISFELPVSEEETAEDTTEAADTATTETTDTTEAADTTSEETTASTDDSEDLVTRFDVEDASAATEGTKPNFVIEGTFKGVGPFSFFIQ